MKILSDIALALVWLTRLPLGRLLPAQSPTLSQAGWAFGLAGLVVGAAGYAGLAVGALVSPVVAGLCAVAAMVWLTGGLHEDGLADFADGMGGRSPERRLEIMRDSRIGSYGALTLGLVTALRVAALSVGPAMAVALLGAAALSRAGMVAGMALMPPARADGLGRGAGRPSVAIAGLALLIGGLPFILSGSIALAVLPPLACLAAQALVARKAQSALGGQTGDVLGAMQQAGEVAALLTFAALLR